MPFSIYVHLPYCRQKCSYCNFISGFKPEKNSIESYITALFGEIDLFKKLHRETGPVKTVYIGGGTPSLLSQIQIKTIFEKLKSEFVLLNNENTIEANPEDVTPEKALSWKSAGINRVSLGFQSMEGQVLKFLGRQNDAGINIRSVHTLRDAGISNISLDLIICIRGEHALKLLESLLSLKPPHISVYQLSVEDKTLLRRNVEAGKYIPLTDFTAIGHYRKIRQELQNAGYKHYEISNFSLEDRYFSSHNMNYWDYGEYIGFGAGASGFFKKLRWTNIGSIKNYSSAVRAGNLPREFTEEINRETSIREYIMLGLRKSAGISYFHFEEIFHTSLEKILVSKIPPELDPFIVKKENRISLTERGFEVSNRVIRELWDLIPE